MIRFNTEINAHFEREKDIDVDVALKDIYEVACNVDKLLKRKRTWYFTGHSKKDALTKVAFDDSGPTTAAYEKVTRNYKKNKPLVTEGVWDGGSDGNACAISHYMMKICNPRKGSIVIEMDEAVENLESMFSMVKFLVASRKKTFIAVDSKGYCLHRRCVFPDRLYVGWMLYIPALVLPELVPEAARILPVLNEEGKQKGTIIVSTEEVFDGSKKEHIEKSNDIEIRLLDLGLLPLMTEI